MYCIQFMVFVCHHFLFHFLPLLTFDILIFSETNCIIITKLDRNGVRNVLCKNVSFCSGWVKNMPWMQYAIFICPSRDRSYYVIGYGFVHTGFRTITLVLYIRSLHNLATWFPCGKGRTLFILGSLVQRSRSLLL